MLHHQLNGLPACRPLPILPSARWLTSGLELYWALVLVLELPVRAKQEVRLLSMLLWKALSLDLLPGRLMCSP